MPAKMNQFNMHTRSPPCSPRCAHSTVQFSTSNSLTLIRSNQPISGGNPHPAPPPPSPLSRPCCCEDEMSVLLKVPLRHNSDLWCLTVLFQSQERGRERIFMAWNYFRAVTTDRRHREAPLTASAPIQIENSKALTNNTSQMMEKYTMTSWSNW